MLKFLHVTEYGFFWAETDITVARIKTVVTNNFFISLFFIR